MRIHSLVIRRFDETPSDILIAVAAERGIAVECYDADSNRTDRLPSKAILNQWHKECQ